MSGVGDYRYVDCVAINAGKQEALEYIRTLYDIPLSHCMAAGDSGNDTLMLEGGLWCHMGLQTLAIGANWVADSYASHGNMDPLIYIHHDAIDHIPVCNTPRCLDALSGPS